MNLPSAHVHANYEVNSTSSHFHVWIQTGYTYSYSNITSSGHTKVEHEDFVCLCGQTKSLDNSVPESHMFYTTSDWHSGSIHYSNVSCECGYSTVKSGPCSGYPHVIFNKVGLVEK